MNRAGQAGFNIISRTGRVPVGTASSFVINYADPNRARAERLSATVALLMSSAILASCPARN